MKHVESEGSVLCSVRCGSGCIQLLNPLLTTIQAARVMVLIDEMVYATPFGERAVAAAGSGRHISVDQHSSNEPTVRDVQHLAVQIAAERPDAVVAVGGGSTIDAVKAALAQHMAQRDITFLWGSPNLEPRTIAFVAVPTTCGTGSELTPFAVIHSEHECRKRSLRHSSLIPDAAILDPDSLETLPSNVVALTGIDAFCHALESFVSVDATSISQTMCLGPLVAAARVLRAAVHDRDQAALATLQAAAGGARMCFPLVGLTVAHSMSHPLGIAYGLPHGEAVARCTPPVIRYNGLTAPSGYGSVARYLGICAEGASDRKCAEALADWTARWFADLAAFRQRPSLSQRLPMEAMVRHTLESGNIRTNPRLIQEGELGDLFEAIVRSLGTGVTTAG